MPPPRVQTKVLLYKLLAERIAIYVHFLTQALSLCTRGTFHLSEGPRALLLEPGVLPSALSVTTNIFYEPEKVISLSCE